MKLLTQYLNHALNFESLAATETNPKLKAALASRQKPIKNLPPSAQQSSGCLNRANQSL
jgi:hypothetical protein